MYTIYSLIDPRNCTTRYIGASQNVRARLQRHLSCRDGNHWKNNWIRELRSLGLTPGLEILEAGIADEAYARHREGVWIAYHMGMGSPLFNIDKPIRRVQCEPETRLRKGRARSLADTIELLSEMHAKGGIWPESIMISRPMQRYYRREYPAFFVPDGDEDAQAERKAWQEKAADLRAAERPSRAFYPPNQRVGEAK